MKYVIALYLLPVMALAEEAAEVEKLPWWEELPMKLGEWFVSLDDLVGGPALLGLAAVLEVAMRLVKTKKPLSIAHGILSILKGVEGLLGLIIKGLDKIIPQKTE